MQERLNSNAKVALAIVLVAVCCATSRGAESSRNPASRTVSEPAPYQGPTLIAQFSAAANAQNQQGPVVQGPNVPPPNVPVPNPSPNPVPPPVPGAQPLMTPPQTIIVPVSPLPANVSAPTVVVPAPAPPTVVVPPPAGAVTTPAGPTIDSNSPLLDGKLPTEELLPPVVQQGGCEDEQRQGVQPYGGGHPTDWSWGCGGSPYRTGPGLCDNWKVGCRWHVTVDGMVMTRERADLKALADEMEDNHQGAEDLEDPIFVNFDHAPGGRITFTSQVGRCTCWDMMVAYEGIEAWNSSITFEREDFEPVFYTPTISTTVTTDTDTNNETDTTTITTTNTNNSTQTVTTTVNNTVGVAPNTTVTTDTTTTTNTNNQTATNTQTNTDTDNNTETETTTEHSYAAGPTPLQPGDPFPEGTEQRVLHYRSSLQSGELNFVRCCDPAWRPYCGVRYIKFDDEINDFTNQEVQTPVPFAGPDPGTGPGQFLGVATTDRLNLFHVQNNLMGFQAGMLHDSWRLNDRLALDGNINVGVYYNKIKYSNVTGIFTTQTVTDDVSTTAFNEARTDVSNTINNDVRELSEISCSSEASLSAVCRLNRCWALRAGYQVMWINNVHLAEDAYLHDGETVGRDLLFHGWHAGVECRR